MSRRRRRRRRRRRASSSVARASSRARRANGPTDINMYYILVYTPTLRIQHHMSEPTTPGIPRAHSRSVEPQTRARRAVPRRTLAMRRTANNNSSVTDLQGALALSRARSLSRAKRIDDRRGMRCMIRFDSMRARARFRSRAREKDRRGFVFTRAFD
jgi:hypothetical protein